MKYSCQKKTSHPANIVCFSIFFDKCTQDMKLITRISAVRFSWLFFYHAWKAPVVYVNVREQQERGLWLYFKESYNYLRKRFGVCLYFLEAFLVYSRAASVAMSQLQRRSWAQDTVCLECYMFSLYLFGFSTGSVAFFCLHCRWTVCRWMLVTTVL